MRRIVPLIAIALAACAPQDAAGAKKIKPPTLKVEVSQSPQALAAGEEGEILVQVVPPEGIALNRYPGITLTIEDTGGFEVPESKLFVGETEPLDDPDEFQFETIDPLRVRVGVPASAGAGAGEMKGTLKFFYCRKKDGFCAPATQSVRVPVAVQ